VSGGGRGRPRGCAVGAEASRGGGGGGAAAGRQVRGVADAQHLDAVSVCAEAVRYGPVPGTRRRTARSSVPVRVSATSAAAAGAAQRRPEGATELERHDVVEDRVDDGAHVVEYTRRVEQHRLESLAVEDDGL